MAPAANTNSAVMVPIPIKAVAIWVNGRDEHADKVPIRPYKLDTIESCLFHVRDACKVIKGAPRVPGPIRLVVVTMTAHARLVFGPGSGAMGFLQRSR